MSFKDLLVHVGPTKASKKCIESAIVLSKRYNAHLTGLHITVNYTMPTYVASALPANIQATYEQSEAQRAQQIKELYTSIIDSHGANCDFRMEAADETEIADIISLHGRYSDLIVMQQPDPSMPFSTSGQSLIEEVVLESGRAVMVVPYIGARDSLGKNVTIAWDASREAARAVWDALPLLRDAEKVTILIVNKGKKQRGHGEEPGADIARHLARHDIACEVHNTTFTDISVGDAILSQIADLESDLLVMGAYGHQRWRELILGGVTQTLLKHMTIPVLMSH